MWQKEKWGKTVDSWLTTESNCSFVLMKRVLAGWCPSPCHWWWWWWGATASQGGGEEASHTHITVQRDWRSCRPCTAVHLATCFSLRFFHQNYGLSSNSVLLNVRETPERTVKSPASAGYTRRQKTDVIKDFACAHCKIFQVCVCMWVWVCVFECGSSCPGREHFPLKKHTSNNRLPCP